MSSLLIGFEADRNDERVSMRLRRIKDSQGNTTNDSAYDSRLSVGKRKISNLKPGLYLLEASWRDGNITTHWCSVKDSEDVEFHLSVPMQKRRIQALHRDFSQPSAGGMFRGIGRVSPQEEFYTVFSSDEVASTWELLRDRGAIERKAPFFFEGRPLHRSRDVTPQLREGSGRNWLVYWACDHWSVSSLPNDRTKNEFTLLRSDPSGLPFVAVNDPDMQMMTDMLSCGNAEVSRRYALATYADLGKRDLRKMIKDHPLEMCAFAYGDYENFSDASWGGALNILADHHHWISDVCIILGWQALMTARDSSGWVKAGDLFEKAVKIGVPYYSLGIRLLSEGLTMLATETPRHRESAKLVCSVAAKVVLSETFTTISL